MPIKREPFERQTDDADFDKPDIISVKLNHQERQWLEALKRYYQTPYDSTALKNKAFEVFKQQAELDEVKRS